jgi:predicted nucleic acid-binding protein
MRYVVDANVVLKALLAEPGSAPADALIASHLDGTSSLLAPDLIVAEVANALWKRSVQRQQLTMSEAQGVFDDFLALGIFLHSSSTLAESALRIAIKERHPAYDCFYVALAEQSACPFITADEKLRAKLKRVSILSLSNFVV